VRIEGGGGKIFSCPAVVGHSEAIEEGVAHESAAVA
jgi:hypothetical protein